MKRTERIATVTEPITGITESRRVLSWDEVAFSIQMALMQNVWAGTPHAKRDGIKRMVIDAIREQFKVSGYQMLGSIPKGDSNEPRGLHGREP